MTTVVAEPITSEFPVPAPAAWPPAWNEESFRLVVETHSGRLFSLAYRMTGNAHDAEDLVQESFLRAYRSRGHFAARASVSTWLCRICTNATLDHLRRHKTHPQAIAEPAEGPSWVERMPAQDASPERLLRSREMNLRIRAALAALSPKERAAFVLRHYEGLSIEEIGAALGLRPAATKNTIFRGVRKLRTALQGL
ncbi:MAG: RNA polymerase sigma factor [Terriglobales bacterium]